MTHLAFLVLFGLVGENNDLFALAVFKHLSAYRSTVNIGCTDFETVVAADCDYFIKSNIGIFVCCKLFDITSPFSTLYCLPPVSIIAYIFLPALI